MQLHYDNLVALASEDAALAPVPSYATIRRYPKARGLHRTHQPKRQSAGAKAAEQRLQSREVRSYEADYVHGLWHLDFHHGSLKVLTPVGQWVRPLLLGILDDHSRVVCHCQWYVDETPEPSAPDELTPLLRKLLAEYAATGRPPAYLPKDDDKEPTT